MIINRFYNIEIYNLCNNNCQYKCGDYKIDKNYL